MKADQHIYDFMYRRIPEKIRGMEVLEIATGPGLLARHVAPAAKRIIATDYSDGMIAQAKKGEAMDGSEARAYNGEAILWDCLRSM